MTEFTLLPFALAMKLVVYEPMLDRLFPIATVLKVVAACTR
jgi:hypothetical protein